MLPTICLDWTFKPIRVKIFLYFPLKLQERRKKSSHLDFHMIICIFLETLKDQKKKLSLFTNAKKEGKKCHLIFFYLLLFIFLHSVAPNILHTNSSQLHLFCVLTEMLFIIRIPASSSWVFFFSNSRRAGAEHLISQLETITISLLRPAHTRPPREPALGPRERYWLASFLDNACCRFAVHIHTYTRKKNMWERKATKKLHDNIL